MKVSLVLLCFLLLVAHLLVPSNALSQDSESEAEETVLSEVESESTSKLHASASAHGGPGWLSGLRRAAKRVGRRAANGATGGSRRSRRGSRRSSVSGGARAGAVGGATGGVRAAALAPAARCHSNAQCPAGFQCVRKRCQETQFTTTAVSDDPNAPDFQVENRVVKFVDAQPEGEFRALPQQPVSADQLQQDVEVPQVSSARRRLRRFAQAVGDVCANVLDLSRACRSDRDCPAGEDCINCQCVPSNRLNVPANARWRESMIDIVDAPVEATALEPAAPLDPYQYREEPEQRVVVRRRDVRRHNPQRFYADAQRVREYQRERRERRRLELEAAQQSDEVYGPADLERSLAPPQEYFDGERAPFDESLQQPAFVESASESDDDQDH